MAPERLSLKVRKALADPAHDFHVSTVSLWEISIKHALGKLRLDGCTPDDMLAAARNMGFAMSAPSAEESASFHRLPRMAHKDPFDRMLIWQCLQRRWVLVTHDRAMAEYRALGLETLS